MKENIHSCFTNKKIEGYGYIEENVVIRSWKIRGFFSLGAFTLLEEGSQLKNALVGKFSRIEKKFPFPVFLDSVLQFSFHSNNQKNNIS